MSIDSTPITDAFNEAADAVYHAGGFDVSQMADPKAQKVIEETLRCISGGINTALPTDVPETLRYALENNAFIFSGLKTFHALREVGLSMVKDDGSIKSFEEFKDDVKQINSKYNTNYLYAEYKHAVGTSQMAAKWVDIEADGDRYDLQYRTAGDDKVRPDHAALNGITLPPSDPFWSKYYPPNGWGCRCTAVQVRVGKYQRSNPADAMQAGDTATEEAKQKMFRYNSGKTMQLFPPKHPYYKAPVGAKAVVQQVAAQQHQQQRAADMLAELPANLTDAEKQMYEAVSKAYHAAGKKVIVILNVCGPLETAPLSATADAILCAFQPGCEAGNSMADVLTGKVNPSGRLPMTFQVAYGDAAADANFPADYVFDMSSFRRAYSGGSAKDAAERAQRQAEPELKKDVDYTNYEEGIYIGYRYFDTFGKPVAYPFGFGLSYTTFSYDLLHSGITGNKCVAQVKVTNTGKVAGKEVIQLYVTAPKGSMDKPSKELKAYAKTKNLRPGESQVLTLEWETMSMASFNEKKSAWELAKGNYQFLVSTSSKDVKATATHKVAKQRLDAVNNVLKPVEKVPVSPLVARK